MGGSRWEPQDWTAYSSSHIHSKATVEEIYTSRKIDASLNPYDVAIRESCDSEANPNSTALIVGLDVTGSMGNVLDAMAREGLKTLATEIYSRKPISDPHMMFMGIGDVYYDDAPLQVTQFEADIKIAEQLTKIYLEQGGGGNKSESYTLPWYFASMYTKIDCFEKRNKKGYLFTIGDECPPDELSAIDIEKVLGTKPQFDSLTSEQLLNMVSKQYEVFHLIVEEGHNYKTMPERVTSEWTKLLGQRAIKLSDHTKMGEVIISTLQLLNGDNKDKIIDSWDGTTKVTVANAIKDLDLTKHTNTDKVITF